MPRYRFSEFILSPRRRVLLRNGREQPLIPRYFDLLVFLVERRGDAVHRRDIFDRGLERRRRLGQRPQPGDPHDPSRARRRLARAALRAHRLRGTATSSSSPTSSRKTTSGDWQRAWTLGRGQPRLSARGSAEPIAYAPLLERIDARGASTRGRRRGSARAAERLHALGTSEALRRLGTASAVTPSRERCCATRAGTLPRPARCRSSASPSACGGGWHLVHAAAPACTGNGGRPMGAGVARRRLAGIARRRPRGALLLMVAPGTRHSSPSSVLPLHWRPCDGRGAGGAASAPGLAVAESVLRSRRTLVTDCRRRAWRRR